MAGETDLHTATSDACLADRFEQVVTAATPSPADDDVRQGASSEPLAGEEPSADKEPVVEASKESTAETAAPQAAKEQSADDHVQLERYFEQIKRMFVGHQQLLAIAKTDNTLLSDELRQVSDQYESRIAKLEQQNRDYVDLITSELDGLKGENNRLKNEVSSKDIENSLLVKNFQLQEENLEHLKKELAEASTEELSQQLNDLKSAHDELKERQESLATELKATAEERDSLRRELADEEDQKNALISRFRAEIATLEEKHSLQLERQQLEMDKKLLSKAQAELASPTGQSAEASALGAKAQGATAQGATDVDAVAKEPLVS